MADYLCDGCQAHYDAVRGPAGRPRRRRGPTRRGWSAGSTTTRGPRSSSYHALLGAQSRHRRRRPLRRAVGGDRRPAAAGHRLRRSASTAPARARGRGRRAAGRRPPVRGLRRAARGRGPARSVRRSSPRCAARGVPPTWRYGERGLKGAMKAADRSRRRATRWSSATATAKPAWSQVKDLDARRADVPSRCDDSGRALAQKD